MDPKVAQISELLHQAAETHHVVFAITDGTDPDWATVVRRLARESFVDWRATRSPVGPKRVDVYARGPCGSCAAGSTAPTKRSMPATTVPHPTATTF